MAISTKRLGMIAPSSNTCLEPMTYRMLQSRDDVTVHTTRVPVTRIALDSVSDDQFDVAAMRSASALLASARVDVVGWNGTSGSWLGVDHDRAIVDEISKTTGVPATTSTLAYLSIFARQHIGRIALVTPYTTDVNDVIIRMYRAAGIDTVSSVALGMSDNESFARVTPGEIVERSREVATARPDAIVYLCTNLYGAPAVHQVERETGCPVLDSVAVTLWRCLELAGAPLLDERWGRLLTS